ncbi:MAG: GNAT family N-acetyltransferase [Clostridium sp.]|nr:GNAT family N-acetyltransferase [Clostridium sp.]
MAGFSTFSERDELPEQYGFTPFIGFVFVGEKYRGRRLSERMIQSIISYAKEELEGKADAISFQILFRPVRKNGKF